MICKGGGGEGGEGGAGGVGKQCIFEGHRTYPSLRGFLFNGFGDTVLSTTQVIYGIPMGEAFG